MSKQPRIDIVLTNGKVYKIVVWFQKIKTGWSFAPHRIKFTNVNNQDFHYTHHDNGTFMAHEYDQPKKKMKTISLNNFKDFLKLWHINILPKISGQTMWEDYDLQKSKNEQVLIDIREFEKANSSIYLDFYLIDAQKPEFLKQITNNLPKAKIIVFDKYEPWFVICISKRGT